MSLSASDVAYYQSVLNSSFASLVPMIFVVYDWILTFDQEVSLIWGNLGTGSILFLINRYAYLLLISLQLIISFGPQIPSICGVPGYIVYALGVILWVVIAVFSAARVWALTAQNRVLSASVLCIALVPAAVNLYYFIETPFVGIFPGPLPFGGCAWQSNVPAVVGKMLGPIARAASILGDVLVLAITWMNMYRSYTLTKSLKDKQSRFGTTDMMLLYGTGYFGVMFVFSVLQLIFADIFSGFTIGFLISQMNRPICNVLISRFILDLKQAVRHCSPTTMASMSDIIFTVPRGTLVYGVERTRASLLEEGGSNAYAGPRDIFPVALTSNSAAIEM